VNVGLPATEAVDPETAAIDVLGSLDLARMLVDAQQTAVDAATAAVGDLARAIDTVARALLEGRHAFVIGAGTSGRLGVLDAAELPPTFGVDPDLVRARIAGGDRALRNAVEGAEDDTEAGAAAVADVRAGDVVIGLSASGGAPFVRGALAAARAGGAATIAIVNAAGSPLASEAQIAIVLATGAEPIAGSTRMKAGTAQKIALNTISTGAMIRLGKTYGNRMIDVVATNAKLRDRASRLVRELCGEAGTEELLEAAGGRVKTAVTMARLGCDRAAAEAALAAAQGRLAAVIGAPRTTPPST
jgi:N-acetylmuramic acid 6-phosphate etherase